MAVMSVLLHSITSAANLVRRFEQQEWSSAAWFYLSPGQEDVFCCVLGVFSSCEPPCASEMIFFNPHFNENFIHCNLITFNF